MSGSRSSTLTARVIKALGIFTGLEAVTMLCAIVRTKLVALWIGAAGVGIISLYNSTLELLKALMHLNLRQSAVREIASASDTDRPAFCSGARRCALILGIGSALITAAAAPLLSRLTFESDAYTWGFVVLSVTMLAAAVSSGRAAVLQALGQLAALARASFWAAITSTAAAVVLFYFFRMSAIVPVLLIFPLSTLLFLLLQRPDLEPGPAPDLTLVKSAARRMARLGLWLTAAAGITLAGDYALRVYLNARGGLDTVGIFQAGYTIVNTYLGVVFTAISMEFFPRLSATIHRRHMTSIVVSHEITLTTWIMLPVVIIFISADSLILNILYSSDFIDALPLMTIGVTGTTLRAASWCMAYVIVSKGDGRAYLLTESISTAVMLTLSIILWHQIGIAGIGIAYALQYLIYTILTYTVCRKRYKLTLTRGTALLIPTAAAISLLALILKHLGTWWTPLLLLTAIIPLTLHHTSLLKSKK